MVYVLSKNDKPLMPCTEAKARKLLIQEKAKCIRREPFIIKLLFDCENIVQEVVAGMDTGSKVIGTACISNGKVIYQAETYIRDDVSKKIQQRKMYRRARRNRKTRYRKPRFLNRSSSNKLGRLAPSIKSKINSHLKEKNFIQSILPISKWILELASFDIHKITNPEVSGIDYQNGAQKDYYNVKAYILDRDNYQCQKCKLKNIKFNIHHIIYKSQGGTNTPNNLITLCENCHNKLHKGEFIIKAKKSSTKYATEIGIIKSQLKKYFGNFLETYGYETKYKRENILNLNKNHYNDAIAICCNNKSINLYDNVLCRRHISKGDYKQTKGKRSEIKLPTGKLFGFKKYDKVKTSKGIFFIKGKRNNGRFDMSDILGNSLLTINVIKYNILRLSSRKHVISLIYKKVDNG